MSRRLTKADQGYQVHVTSPGRVFTGSWSRKRDAEREARRRAMNGSTVELWEVRTTTVGGEATGTAHRLLATFTGLLHDWPYNSDPESDKGKKMKLKSACETPLECSGNKHKAGCPASSAMAKIVAGWVGAGLPLDEIVNRFDEISVLEYASRILEATGESQ